MAYPASGGSPRRPNPSWAYCSWQGLLPAHCVATGVGSNLLLCLPGPAACICNCTQLLTEGRLPFLSAASTARCGHLGSERSLTTQAGARRAVWVWQREHARHHISLHTRWAPPLGASTTPGGLWGVPTALAPAGLACGAPTAPAEAAKAVLADMGLQHVWPQSGGMWPSRPNPRPLRAT